MNLQANLSNAPAGPGAQEDVQIAPKPLLEGASEYEYVTILNPLSVDFYGKVAITRPANVPFEVGKDASGGQVTLNESDVLRNYGLNLKNKDHMARINVINRVHIPAGKTLNLLGNEAQVVCRQLVNEIMQREGKRLMLADPHQRSLVEQRIVLSRRSVNDILGEGPMAVQEQLSGAVDKLNTENKPDDTTEFPDLTSAANRAATALTDGAGDSQPPSRVFVGRPKGSKNKVSQARGTTAHSTGQTG